MKILVAHNFYRSNMVGGEDVVVQREVAALREVLGDHNIHTYFVYNDDIQYTQLAKNIFHHRQHAKNITDLIHQHHIDIVHVHNFFPLLTSSVLIAAKQAGAKVIQTLHNFRPWCLSGILYREQQRCTRCVDKSFAWPAVQHGCYRGSKGQSLLAASAFGAYQLKNYQNSIDAYFVLSKTQQQQCEAFHPKTPMLLKPNFVPMAAPTRSDKQGWLFVGRLEEAKGIRDIIRCWQQLSAPPSLTIIGEGPLLSWAKEQSQGLPIHFLGKQPPEVVQEYYASAAFCLHTSKMLETFGLTMLESLSHGTPVVGYAIGTRQETIRDGENGFLCEPGKLSEVVNKVNDCADYDRISQNAVKSAQPFTKARVIQQQLGYYRQIL